MSDYLTFDKSTNTLTVTENEGVDYFIGSKKLSAGDHKLTKNTTVRARVKPGKRFAKGAQTQFEFNVSSESSESSDSVDEPTGNLVVDSETDTPTVPDASYAPQVSIPNPNPSTFRNRSNPS